MPQIDQNLLSITHLVKKNYPVLFKDKACIIIDPVGQEQMTIQMKDRNFSLK